MSSSSPPRPDRRRRRRAVAALVAAVAVGAAWSSSAGAAARLDVVAVVPVPAARYVSLVAGVSPPPASVLRTGAFSVTTGDTRTAATAMPLISDELTTGLVLDTSAEGAGALQGGVSGATGFLLQLPAGARTAVVTDGGPPAVLVPLGEPSTDAVAALSSVRAGGRRDTGAALELALARLPEIPGRPRLLLLCTGAPDAGGRPAADLAGRLRAANVLLAVVATGDDQRYWSRVTADTGGVLVPARGQPTLGAFDEVARVLRGRYVLTFPLPAVLPAPVQVRVDTPDGTATATATATATVPGPATAATGGTGGTGGGRSTGWLPLVLGVLAVAGLVAVLLLRRHRSRAGRPEEPPDATPAPAAPALRRPMGAAPPVPAPAVPAPAGTVPTATRAAAGAPAAPLVLPSRTPGAARPVPAARAVPSNPVGASTPAVPGAYATRPAPGHHLAPGHLPWGRPAPGGAAVPGRPGPAVQPSSRSAAVRPGDAPHDRDPGGGRLDDRGRDDASPHDAPQAAGPDGASPHDAGPHDAGPDERDPDELAYARLDAEVGRLGAEVAAGRLDARRAAARIAMSAPGRLDLLDRVIGTERRLRGSRLAASAAVLDLLVAARRVVAGEVPLVGPAGVRVQQAQRGGPAGARHPVLLLRHRDGPVRECRSVDELARLVDVSTLTVDPPVEARGQPTAG